jgi:hypothetical protein
MSASSTFDQDLPNSWEPIRGHKITRPFKSRYEMTTSNPLSSGEDTSAYKDKRQDSEEEEESSDNGQVYDEDGDEEGDDGDNDYDDIENDYASKIQKTLKSDGSNTGLQAIYEREDDGVPTFLNQVPYPANTKDGTRSYEHGSSSRSSENGTEDNERTENIIQSRIDHLKERIKREMARNFYP